MIVFCFCGVSVFPVLTSAVFAQPALRLPVSDFDGQDVIAEKMHINLLDYGFDVISLLDEKSITFEANFIHENFNGKQWVKTASGQTLILPEYDRILEIGHSGFWILRDAKWALFDEKGQAITDFCFEDINPFNEGKSVVKCGNKWGVIDLRGKWIIASEYDFADKFVHEGILPYLKNGNCGFVRMDGKVISPPIYQGASGFSGGVAIVQKNDRCALVRTDMSLITDYEFEYAFRPSDGMIAVCKDGKWGYVTDCGKQCTPCMYDFALRFRQGIGYVLKDKKWMLLHSNGKQGMQVFSVTQDGKDHCACPVAPRKSVEKEKNDVKSNH